MRAWSIERDTGGAAGAALAELIGAIGRGGFARAALEPLHRVLGIGSWSAYRLRPDAPPLLHLSASHGRIDVTPSCFAAYLDDGLYRADTSFAPVYEPRRDAGPVMLRMSADEAPSEAHRDAIYRRHGMLERLTVARLDADGSLLAVNVYRHRARGPFGAAEVERFGELAEPLLAAVARHVDWPAGADPRALLRRRCPALTDRELDVLERLLAGLTYDGIAADLGLSLSSVKTYRSRAFQRLDVHFRHQLHALIRANPVDLPDDSAGGP